MATSIVNFRLDDNDKKGMEMVCDAIGLSMSAAFTIFAKKVSREKRFLLIWVLIHFIDGATYNSSTMISEPIFRHLDEVAMKSEDTKSLV